MTSRDASAAERRARAREARAKLAALRAQLREVLAAKKARVRELVRVVRAERLALRERLRAHRTRVLEELRATSRAERTRAREGWTQRRAAARAESATEIAAARAALAAERERVKAERAADRKLREGAVAHARAARSQSDETVRSLIPGELVPLFDRVSGRVRGSSSESRAEAFLRYAEKHPEETFKAVEPRAQARVEEAQGAVAQATRGHGVAGFAEKRAARIERMHAKAARLGTEAESVHAQARRTGDLIPFGQPVLVGHHSQRRHERDLARIDRGYRKSFALSDKATELERRATHAESARTVFSDDPEAIDKLKEKLARLNKLRETMRHANAVIRRGSDVVSALGALGIREETAKQLLEKDFAGRIGFPDYKLRNTASEAKRIEKRIRELEARASTAAPTDVVIGGGRISEADNRVRVTFPSMPPAAMRRALKAAGFRWSPTANAWQRHASNGAWYAAKAALTANQGTTTGP